MDDATAVVATRGWFVFVIGHPCFLAPGASTVDGPDGRPGRFVSSYFDEGFWRSANPDGIRGRAGSHHRTLSTYLSALVAAGFGITAVDEPRASARLLAQQPVYQQLPIFLGVRAGPSRSGGISERYQVTTAHWQEAGSCSGLRPGPISTRF